MPIHETSGHQLNIGDKVKMNIAVLGKGDLDGVEFTRTGKDYWRYMNEHPDEVYEITGFDFTNDACIYILSGYMSDNTWAADELIHVPEPESMFEVIKNMTLDEMVTDLLPILLTWFKDNVPSPEEFKALLLTKPDKSIQPAAASPAANPETNITRDHEPLTVRVLKQIQDPRLTCLPGFEAFKADIERLTTWASNQSLPGITAETWLEQIDALSIDALATYVKDYKAGQLDPSRDLPHLKT